MSVFRDLLRIKTFRENQAESRVRQARAVALDAQQAREAAEALLATVSDYPWSRIEERAVA